MNDAENIYIYLLVQTNNHEQQNTINSEVSGNFNRCLNCFNEVIHSYNTCPCSTYAMDGDYCFWTSFYFREIAIKFSLPFWQWSHFDQ